MRWWAVHAATGSPPPPDRVLLFAAYYCSICFCSMLLRGHVRMPPALTQTFEALGYTDSYKQAAGAARWFNFHDEFRCALMVFMRPLRQPTAASLNNSSMLPRSPATSSAVAANARHAGRTDVVAILCSLAAAA